MTEKFDIIPIVRAVWKKSMIPKEEDVEAILPTDDLSITEKQQILKKVSLMLWRSWIPCFVCFVNYFIHVSPYTKVFSHLGTWRCELRERIKKKVATFYNNQDNAKLINSAEGYITELEIVIHMMDAGRNVVDTVARAVFSPKAKYARDLDSECQKMVQQRVRMCACPEYCVDIYTHMHLVDHPMVI
jgi:hypothetical protein